MPRSLLGSSAAALLLLSWAAGGVDAYTILFPTAQRYAGDALARVNVFLACRNAGLFAFDATCSSIQPFLRMPGTARTAPSLPLRGTLQQLYASADALDFEAWSGTETMFGSCRNWTSARSCDLGRATSGTGASPAPLRPCNSTFPILCACVNGDFAGSLSPTTGSPTARPTTKQPSVQPTTLQPTLNPTSQQPSVQPTTQQPTPNPTTRQPTLNPATTSQPTTRTPTSQSPSRAPTQKPTVSRNIVLFRAAYPSATTRFRGADIAPIPTFVQNRCAAGAAALCPVNTQFTVFLARGNRNLVDTLADAGADVVSRAVVSHTGMPLAASVSSFYYDERGLYTSFVNAGIMENNLDVTWLGHNSTERNCENWTAEDSRGSCFWGSYGFSNFEPIEVPARDSSDPCTNARTVVCACWNGIV